MINNSLYHHLDNGEIDLLLGNDAEADGTYRIILKYQAQPYYLATTKGKTDIRDGLNSALGQILGSIPDFSEVHHEKNMPELKGVNIVFMEDEKEYIAETGTLKVSVVSRWHPLYCLDGDMEHDGIIPGILEEVSRKTGLKFEYVLADTYQEAIQLVQDGKADILGCYLGTEMTAKEQGLPLTVSYASLNNVVVKNKSVIYPSEGLTAALVEGTEITGKAEDAEVLYYPTIQETLEAVNSGEADYTFGPSASIEQLLQSRRLPEISVTSMNNDSSSLAFALPKPVSTLLLRVLNTSLSNVSSEEKDNLVNKNLIMGAYSNVSLTDLLYANPVAGATAIGILAIFVIGIVMMTAHFRIRNAVMQSELEKAEAMGRAKTDFLSRMSHEIRTPMNAIVGLSDLAFMNKNVPPEVEEYLSKIRSSSRYLLSLINDILDMARIENNKMVLADESFSMEELLDEVESVVQTQAQRRNIECTFHSELQDKWFSGDEIRLKQVLVNLLTNAVKFTPEGGQVSLELKETECRDGEAVLYFSVKDNGVGISDEGKKRIFDAFEQEGTISSQSAGTGLGLPISSSIVEMMGGRLEVDSTLGKGSDFHFTVALPVEAERVTEKKPDMTEECDLDGVKILLAEDNDLNAEIAAELLEIKGAVVSRAADGAEAVELFMSSKPDEYQLILMDIQMPVKNGLEASREIRGSMHPDAEKIPIVAMTANSFQEDLDAAMESGMNGFISKPVDLGELYGTIKKSLE